MENKKIDLLNRKSFIDSVVKLIEVTAQSKEHRTFAINGEWGLGKTWVLEEIEKELNNKKSEKGKRSFFVIHYNCWEYDYYQEPLIAIVSALLNSIEEAKFIPSRTKASIKQGLKTIGKTVLSIGSLLIKPYIGIDVDDAINHIKNPIESSNKEREKQFDFDEFYKFKEALEKLKKELSKLSEKYTIVFCVDELDRCLPQYAIKVLERLHHVFEGVSNLQVVLSIDKTQLDETIKTIFGTNVNISGYLSKFFDFSISLPFGDFEQEKFDELFADYVANFQSTRGDMIVQDMQGLLTDLFYHTNIRRKIKIVEKAKLVHSLMTDTDDALTLDHLSIEILLSMASFIYGDLKEEFDKEINDFEDVINSSDEKQQEFFKIVEKVFNEKTASGHLRCSPPRNDREFYLFDVADQWGLLFVVLLKQHSSVNVEYRFTTHGYLSNYTYSLFSYAKSVANILKLIS